MDINVARVFFPVKTLGPGNRVGIWFSGCPFDCDGCISPELQMLNYGKKISVNRIIELILGIDKQIDGITISGGEPFFQSEGLYELLEKLNVYFEDIIVFTGFDYKDLLEGEDYYARKALNYISLIIDGKFEKENVTATGLRGSSNQNIIQLKNIYGDEDFYENSKQMQMVFYNKNILEIGIPGG